MSKIYCRYLKYLQKSVSHDFLNSCSRYDKDMFRTDILKIWLRYYQDMSKKWPRYAKNMPKICQCYNKVMAGYARDCYSYSYIYKLFYVGQFGEDRGSTDFNLVIKMIYHVYITNDCLKMKNIRQGLSRQEGAWEMLKIWSTEMTKICLRYVQHMQQICQAKKCV